MSYKLGTPKDLDSITKEDVLEHKLWIWAWEANLEEDFSEDYQVPVKGIDNITKEFVEPIITLRIKGTDIIASGSLNYKKGKVFGLAIWKKSAWELITKSSLEEPVVFESLIKIDGKEKVEFVMINKNMDEAFSKTLKPKSWWKF